MSGHHAKQKIYYDQYTCHWTCWNLGLIRIKGKFSAVIFDLILQKLSEFGKDVALITTDGVS